jgi:hypothetical protein
MSSTYRIPLFQRYAFAGPDLGRRDISGQAGDTARDPRHRWLTHLHGYR